MAYAVDGAPRWAAALHDAAVRLQLLLGALPLPDWPWPSRAAGGDTNILSRYIDHRLIRAIAYVAADDVLQPAIVALDADTVEPLVFIEEYMTADLSAPHQILKTLLPRIGDRRARGFAHHKWPADTPMLRGERVMKAFTYWDRVFRGDNR